MIAVQMNAFAVGDQVALVFNTVLNELSRGVEDEGDEEREERADRSYWEVRVGKEILSVLDRLLEILRQWDPKFELQYLKGRINVTKDGEPARFVVFRPKRQFLRLETRLPQSEETDRHLEAAGLDLMPYKWNKYRVRLTKTDAARHEPLLTELMRRAYESRE
jgi:hypothetical protein